MKSVIIEEIERNLTKLQDKYEVVLFGSYAEGGAKPDSDIDLAIITRNHNNNENMHLQKELLGLFPFEYDLRIFELLPINIKISIITNYRVIFGDPLEISEYFYRYRILWNDCKHRYIDNQYSSHKEQLEIIQNLKESINRAT